ncbi:MAG TPA: DUF2085 domain-containing protein [Ignavibacteria bacterium]|nr:DUF2085 domain-containing protein [Ignavibacteria bacterium]
MENTVNSPKKIKLSDIALVSCHRIPSRSFFYKGKQFPVCARCTGTYIGFLSMPFFVFDLIYLSWLWTFIFILPTIVDGLTQAFMNRESNNTLRLITGFTYGVGLMSLASLIGKWIGSLILEFIK